MTTQHGERASQKMATPSAVRKYVRVKRRSIAVAASQQNTEVLKVFLAPIISTMTNGSSSYSTISACLAAVFVAGLGAGMMLLTVIQQKRKDQNYKKAAPRRFGAAIRLVDYERYRELHDNVWPKVLERMQKSNIRNFSIHYHKETSTLFQYFEWIGHWKHNASSLDGCCLTKKEERQLFERDMEASSNDPVTRKWWKECEPCQEPFSQWPPESLPLSKGGRGDWWTPLENVCHCGYWPTQYSNMTHDPDFVKM